jgi:uncharacterized protein
MRILLIALAGAAILYVVVGLTMYMLQRSLIYVPDRSRIAPSEAGLTGVSEESIRTPDGQTLIAWWSPPRPGRPVILYFHGNGGNLANRATRILHFQSAGYGVLMLSYRGYGGSTGRPSETANVADALLAYDHLVAKGRAAGSIVLFGESLGTGVATQVAERHAPLALVLDSPFTSLADAAQWHYPWLPAQWLIVDRYEILSRIGRIRAPLLILHGGADSVVPPAMGRRVFEAANEPKRIIVYPEAEHLQHTQQGSLEDMRGFIDGRIAARS